MFIRNSGADNLFHDAKLNQSVITKREGGTEVMGHTLETGSVSGVMSLILKLPCVIEAVHAKTRNIKKS